MSSTHKHRTTQELLDKAKAWNDQEQHEPQNDDIYSRAGNINQDHQDQDNNDTMSMISGRHRSSSFINRSNTFRSIDPDINRQEDHEYFQRDTREQDNLDILHPMDHLGPPPLHPLSYSRHRPIPVTPKSPKLPSPIHPNIFPSYQEVMDYPHPSSPLPSTQPQHPSHKEQHVNSSTYHHQEDQHEDSTLFPCYARGIMRFSPKCSTWMFRILTACLCGIVLVVVFLITQPAFLMEPVESDVIVAPLSRTRLIFTVICAMIGIVFADSLDSFLRKELQR